MRSTLRSGDLVLDDAARLLRADGFVARARPWPGEPGAIHLVTVDRTTPPSPAALSAWLADLATHGATTVRTGALGPTVVGPYLHAGFAVLQELALLTHPLNAMPAAVSLRGARVRLRGPHNDDLVALAMIDRRAFGPRWGMDLAGIVEACQATPVHRLRVARATAVGPVAFAISGRAGRAAYLQRLAVAPSAQGQGIGRALVVDSLQWARRRHATSVLVNTHVGNEPALELYRSLGFVELAYRLAVLERKLP